MKQFISLLLILSVSLTISTRAIAADEVDVLLSEVVMEEPDVVFDLEDLQTALTYAVDGDTIAVADTIQLNGKVATDKNITLIRADGFANAFFSTSNQDGELSGLTILDNLTKSTAIIVENESLDLEVTFNDCNFVGQGNYYSNLVNVFAGTVKFSGCKFENGGDTALNISSRGSVIVKQCTFKQNQTQLQGGAICNRGTLALRDSEIINNQAGVGGAIFNSGDLTISNCEIRHNKSTENKGNDIYSSGVFSISDQKKENAGFYNEITSQKLELPIVRCADAVELIYLTTEDAEKYFTSKGDDEPLPSEPDDEKNTDSTGNTGADGFTDPQEPPIDNLSPQNPETEGSEQEMPQETSEEQEEDDDDYTPAPLYKPVIKPTAPAEGTSELPEPTANLVCGDAVIDCFRSAVLYGYGDGLLHEDDPLTRAQMAVIIFRLLDEESTAKLSTPLSSFVDVPADAWCAPYVLPLADAGVVNGTGGGYYSPNNLATWGQFLTVLGRFVEPQECILWNIQYDGWARPAVMTAVVLGWIEDSAAVNPNAVITRGEAVAVINTVLEMNR